MKLLYAFILFIPTLLIGCNHSNTDSSDSSKPGVNIELTRIKAKDALDFCNAQKFNTDFCILIDMSLHSGINRFLIWDFKNDTISHSFLVGHGCGKKTWNDDCTKDDPKFSNVNGSHCSSLGRYKIGQRAYSEWGVNIKYVLHGLDSTNNNALKRTIVFHSWEVVSDEEVYPKGTPEGWGCPTISNNSFKTIDPLLKASAKPILMWIYK